MLTAARYLTQLALKICVLESKLIKSMHDKLYLSMITLKQTYKDLQKSLKNIVFQAIYC